MSDSILPWLVFITETDSVLCEVRAEVEERIDDAHNTIKLVI
jgi:hypothetical protein